MSDDPGHITVEQWAAIEARQPAGFVLVPREPTEHMQIAGFESDAWDALGRAVLAKKGWPYSCRESAECVTGIFRAMLAAAPVAPQCPTTPAAPESPCDASRVIEWAQSNPRPPASVAFTAGPERQAAYWVEWAQRQQGQKTGCFDIEAMLTACVPGGSSCDPQQVADAIREWVAKDGSQAQAPGSSQAPAEGPWKVGNEFLPYHPQASHISPDHRDGWNACYRAALAQQAPRWTPEQILRSQELANELAAKVKAKPQAQPKGTSEYIEVDDKLLTGQAQYLISALMNHDLLPGKTLPEEKYLKLWEVVKAQLRAVHREAVRSTQSPAPAPESLNVPGGPEWLLPGEVAVRIAYEHYVTPGAVQSVAKAVHQLRVSQAPAVGADAALVDALQDALSVCRSVDRSKSRTVEHGGCTMHLQTAEWCAWAETEVAPKLEQALAALPKPPVQGSGS